MGQNFIRTEFSLVYFCMNVKHPMIGPLLTHHSWKMLSISRPPHTHLVQFLVHNSMACQNSERPTGAHLPPKYLDETHEIYYIYIYTCHMSTVCIANNKPSRSFVYSLPPIRWDWRGRTYDVRSLHRRQIQPSIRKVHWSQPWCGESALVEAASDFQKWENHGIY
jgi:hypothetical protein